MIIGQSAAEAAASDAENSDRKQFCNFSVNVARWRTRLRWSSQIAEWSFSLSSLRSHLFDSNAQWARDSMSKKFKSFNIISGELDAAACVGCYIMRTRNWDFFLLLFSALYWPLFLPCRHTRAIVCAYISCTHNHFAACLKSTTTPLFSRSHRQFSQEKKYKLTTERIWWWLEFRMCFPIHKIALQVHSFAKYLKCEKALSNWTKIFHLFFPPIPV